MYFPKLKAAAQQRAGVEQFGGLDRRPGSGAGSLEQMENLWSSGYPALETRPLRRTVTQLAKPNGMTEKDGLFWVDGTALYVNGAKTGLVLTDSRKQLVSMGAYLLIFPDKKYINTQDLTDFGSMENVRATTGEVTFTLCDGTGESLGSYAAGTEAPQEPRTGDLWLDTERSESVMRRYDGSAWTALTEVYTKIAAVGVGLGFRAGDGVTVAGCGAAELNGLHVLQAAEDDWVLVPALCRTLDGQPDGCGDGDAADAGDGLCGGAGQPAVGVQIRHRGRSGGERDIRLRAGRFPQLEQLCGAEHRQLRRRQRLGRTLYRGGGLHGRRDVLQGELHGAHLSGGGRRAPDCDGAVQRRAEGCGEDRGRGGRCGVLSGERRSVRL